MPSLRSALVGVELALVLPPYAFYYTLYTLIHGPSHPAWGIRTSVLCACSRRAMASLTSPDAPLDKPHDMPAPTFPDNAWKPRSISVRTVGRGTRVVSARAPAASEDLLRGIARVGDVPSTDVPVFWVGLKGSDDIDRPAKNGEKVLVYLGGGGMHPTLSPIPYELAKRSGLRVLALAFRASPFPAPLVDLVTGYEFLRARGFRPEDMCFVADSAGGTALTQLLLYLKELREEHDLDTPAPGGAILLSPACNMARFDQPVLKTDYRLPHYRRRIVPRLAYHFDLATLAENVYFNPAHAPPGAHAGTVRAAFVQFGDGELFADDVRALAEGMRRDGVDVRVDEVPGGLHADATIRRLLSGEKAQSWQHMLGAVREMGWTAHEM